jgi:hypothetical protein
VLMAALVSLWRGMTGIRETRRTLR